jgi:hypothetical protein
MVMKTWLLLQQHLTAITGQKVTCGLRPGVYRGSGPEDAFAVWRLFSHCRVPHR